VKTRPGFALVKGACVSQISAMPMIPDQIVEETRVVPGGDLVSPVMTSWKSESDPRIADVEVGNIKGVSREESLVRTRDIARL